MSRMPVIIPILMFFLGFWGGSMIAHSAPLPSPALIGFGQVDGDPFQVDASQFTALSAPGTGSSIAGDGSTFVNRRAPNDGRWGDPLYVDSNDIARAAWTIDFGRNVTAFSFGVTDANDQRGSHWTVNDGFSLPPVRETDPGAINWIKVTFDKIVRRVTLIFDTQHNDGYGITGVKMECRP